MLIDDRTPPSGNAGNAPVEPNWPLWRWLAIAALLGFAAAHAAGLIGYLLLCGVWAAACKAATEAVGYASGLSEWRQ